MSDVRTFASCMNCMVLAADELYMFRSTQPVNRSRLISLFMSYAENYDDEMKARVIDVFNLDLIVNAVKEVAESD